MKFFDIFKDNNDINEKAIIGFIAFVILILFALVDLITGYLGRPLVVNEFIFDSLVWIVLGSFGISGVEKVFNRRTSRGQRGDRMYSPYNDDDTFYDRRGNNNNEEIG